GAGELHRERHPSVAEADDPDQRGAVLRLRDQDVGGGLGGGFHSDTGAPAVASERVAASSTVTTRTPSSALARGGSAPRATRTKWPSSAASGSTLGILGMKMSPSRTDSASPYDRYSGGRSTPLS